MALARSYAFQLGDHKDPPTPQGLRVFGLKEKPLSCFSVDGEASGGGLTAFQSRRGLPDRRRAERPSSSPWSMLPPGGQRGDSKRSPALGLHTVLRRHGSEGCYRFQGLFDVPRNCVLQYNHNASRPQYVSPLRFQQCPSGRPAEKHASLSRVCIWVWGGTGQGKFRISKTKVPACMALLPLAP